MFSHPWPGRPPIHLHHPSEMAEVLAQTLRGLAPVTGEVERWLDRFEVAP